MCSEEVMLVGKLRNLYGGRQCELSPLVFVLVVVGRDIHWWSYLVYMVYLR